MPTLLALLIVAAADVRAERQVHLNAGVVGSSYVFADGRTSAGSLIQSVGGEGHFGWFGLEGTLSALEPLGRTGSDTFLVEARAGYRGERLELFGGAITQVAFSAQPPLQLLPSLRAAYRFDPFTLSAGLFDLQGYAPARVSVDFSRVGFGYVAPIGGEAHATLPVSDTTSLKLQLLFVRVFSAELAMATVGGSFDFEGAR